MNDIDLNTSSNLPASSGSAEGASGGALGGASMADLQKGFIPDKDSADADYQSPMPAPTQNTGFLNRPHGWER